MIIHCPNCDITVNGEECGHNQRFEEKFPYYRTTLLNCPLCGDSILAGQDMISVTFDQYDWSLAIRLWPDPELRSSSQLPVMVRTSLDEANKCFKAKAYLACAVMCGRVIEAICKDFNTQSHDLFGGLKELLEVQVIDGKIFEWGNALRFHRNIGAHASEEIITKEDAKDLLDFSIAICDYVYILAQKFSNFMNRKQQN